MGANLLDRIIFDNIQEKQKMAAAAAQEEKKVAVERALDALDAQNFHKSRLSFTFEEGDTRHGLKFTESGWPVIQGIEPNSTAEDKALLFTNMVLMEIKINGTNINPMSWEQGKKLLGLNIDGQQLTEGNNLPLEYKLELAFVRPPQKIDDKLIDVDFKADTKLGLVLNCNDEWPRIERVNRGSPAEREGLRPGMELVMIMGESTNGLSAEKFSEIHQKKIKEGGVLILTFSPEKPIPTDEPRILKQKKVTFINVEKTGLQFTPEKWPAIARVLPGSEAEQNELEAGMILAEINDKNTARMDINQVEAAFVSRKTLTCFFVPPSRGLLRPDEQIPFLKGMEGFMRGRIFGKLAKKQFCDVYLPQENGEYKWKKGIVTDVDGQGVWVQEIPRRFWRFTDLGTVQPGSGEESIDLHNNSRMIIHEDKYWFKHGSRSLVEDGFYTGVERAEETAAMKNMSYGAAMMLYPGKTPWGGRSPEDIMKSDLKIMNIPTLLVLARSIGITNFGYQDADPARTRKRRLIEKIVNVEKSQILNLAGEPMSYEGLLAKPQTRKDRTATLSNYFDIRRPEEKLEFEEDHADVEMVVSSGVKCHVVLQNLPNGDIVTRNPNVVARPDHPERMVGVMITDEDESGKVVCVKFRGEGNNETMPLGITFAATMYGAKVSSIDKDSQAQRVTTFLKEGYILKSIQGYDEGKEKLSITELTYRDGGVIRPVEGWGQLRTILEKIKGLYRPITLEFFVTEEPPKTLEKQAELKAKKEIKVSKKMKRAWESDPKSEHSGDFMITVQSVEGFPEMDLSVKVNGNMRVSKLHDHLISKTNCGLTPDNQHLIVYKTKEPLEDETLPIGAYGVESDTTLLMVVLDEAEEAEAKLRKQVRDKVRKARMRWDSEKCMMVDEPPPSGGDPEEDLSRTFYRVDEGGAVAFRTTPNMDDRSNAVAASGAFVEAAREPPEFPDWVQSVSAASSGLWLPKKYLQLVQHNSEEYLEALRAASAEEGAKALEWTMNWDKEKKRYYWYNHVTDDRRWKKPDEIQF